jgi:dTDP-4-amino-4,6-dideoxygalactose transaminase
VSDLPYYKKKYGVVCPVARMLNKCTLTLPLYADMTKEEQNKVIKEMEWSTAT